MIKELIYSSNGVYVTKDNMYDVVEILKPLLENKTVEYSSIQINEKTEEFYIDTGTKSDDFFINGVYVKDNMICLNSDYLRSPNGYTDKGVDLTIPVTVNIRIIADNNRIVIVHENIEDYEGYLYLKRDVINIKD